MPVLVTGGAGFIGSNLVDVLVAQGLEVRVLDDFSEGKLENLKKVKDHKNIEIIKGSILDYDLVRRASDHCTCIFHLAADSRIQTGISDPRHSIETNVVGTANVAEAARQNKVSRIVYSASSSAYGRNMLPEDGFNESCKADCLNPYSMSKKAGEDVMDVYCRLYGISTVSLRYFNVYGPRHQEEGRYSTVIAIFRRQLRLGQKMTIVGDGSQRRDFTFVGDVIRANIMAMMNREATGVFNIGTGKNHSISELAAMIEAKHFSSVLDNAKNVEYIPPRLGEAQVTLADVRLAKDTLGWSPTVTLDNGLDVLDMFEKKEGSSSSRIILATR